MIPTTTAHRKHGRRLRRPACTGRRERLRLSGTPQPNGTYNVTYTITVTNEGGAGSIRPGNQTGFDNDMAINSASFTSTVPTNGALNASGNWTLANDQSIAANGTHTYTLVVNVSMNLNGGGGDDQYTSVAKARRYRNQARVCTTTQQLTPTTMAYGKTTTMPAATCLHWT
ncbi:MAG: hypothetical protein IPN33_17305 [Saprospiraceae bacterium]|nr:hypothetical protein [Saprospiraceae bacterium]